MSATEAVKQSVPFFSVVIAVYNKRPYLDQVIRGLLSQEFADFEAIFVDDGSSDGSSELILGCPDSRFRYVLQENQGVSAARNHGIRLARGKVIAFLDADDWYEPEYLREISSLIRMHPEATFYGTGYYTHKNGVRGRSVVPKEISKNSPSLVTDFYYAWSQGAFICASSIAVRKETLLGAELEFRVGESHGEDQEMWFRLAELGPVAFSPQCYANYLLATANSLAYSCRYTEEIPAVTRLAERVKSGALGVANTRSAGIVIERNRIETAINCGRFGQKARALQLLRGVIISPNFLKLKALAIAATLTPSRLISAVAVAKRKITNA
jgi:glycosyltransferase involved in cell wall biosynthesis